MTNSGGEFGLIARFFAPLAGPEGLNLGDDAAIVPPPPDGHDLVVTCDTMVCGNHFLAKDEPDGIGRKLLAVNLSDLAAMGAAPAHYVLATSWPEEPAEGWLTAFTSGLEQMQRAHGISLIGGDTTRTEGPLTLTLTAFGYVARGTALRRSGARRGDLIFVSGTVGDAALALHLAGEPLSVRAPGFDFLSNRLHRPTPRVSLGQALVGLASSAMDVSDGLVADLSHIAEQSGVGADIDAASLPLSDAAAAVLTGEPDLLVRVLTGGDDYELLFTVPPERATAVLEAAKTAATTVTRIGAVRSEPGVTVLDRAGEPLSLPSAGYRHF